MSDAFNTKPAPASEKKLKELYSRIRHMKWDRDTIEDYVEYVYKKHRALRDRNKRSSVDYFVGILTSKRNIDQFKDFQKYAPKERTPSGTEEEKTVDFKGNEYTFLTEIPIVAEIYFYQKPDDRFLFVVRDLAMTPPRLSFLSKFNKTFPDKKINKSKLILLAKKQA